MSIKDPNNRLVCASLLPQQYDFTIVEHCMHDALSMVGQKLLVNMPTLGTQKTPPHPGNIPES